MKVHQVLESLCTSKFNSRRITPVSLTHSRPSRFPSLLFPTCSLCSGSRQKGDAHNRRSAAWLRQRTGGDGPLTRRRQSSLAKQKKKLISAEGWRPPTRGLGLDRHFSDAHAHGPARTLLGAILAFTNLSDIK